jgi:hypothetical protein
MTKRPPEAMVALNVGQPISLGGGVNQNNLVHTRMAYTPALAPLNFLQVLLRIFEHGLT